MFYYTHLTTLVPNEKYIKVGPSGVSVLALQAEQAFTITVFFLFISLSSLSSCCFSSRGGCPPLPPPPHYNIFRGLLNTSSWIRTYTLQRLTGDAHEHCATEYFAYVWMDACENREREPPLAQGEIKTYSYFLFIQLQFEIEQSWLYDICSMNLVQSLV